MKSYIIHLDRATAREDRVDLLRTQLPGEVEVISAIDGQVLTDDQRAHYQRNLYRPRYPFRLRDSEIACFLSHRKTWQQIVDSGDDYALVAEDDILLDPDHFNQALALATAHMTADRLIRFPIINREIAAEMLAETDDIRLFQPKMTALGMHLLLIGRNTAERLLDFTRRFDRPVDTLLQMVWETGVKPYTLWPSGVKEMDTDIGGSLIGSRKSFSEKLWREIGRPLYRLQIATRTGR